MKPEIYVKLLLLILYFPLIVRCTTHKISFPVIEKNASEAYRKWIKIESRLKEGVNSIVKAILPTITESNIDVTDECSSDLLELLLAIKDMKLWAFKMLDASAKPSGGEMMGRLGSYGSYEECLDVVFPSDESEEVSVGQYCLLDLRTPLPPSYGNVAALSDVFAGTNVTFQYEIIEILRKIASSFYDLSLRFGICVPSSCTKEDILKVISPLINNSGFNAVIYSCETKEPLSLDATQWVIIGMISIVVFLNILSLILMAFCERTSEVISAFNPLKNFLATMKTESSDSNKNLEFLHGIRVITMIWVILTHTNMSIDLMILRNLSFLEHIRKDFASIVIHNGTVAVDTFFFLSAFLMTFILIKQIDKDGLKSFSSLLLIIRRILRLLPSEMLLIGLTILLPLIGSGPLWNDIIGHFANNCREKWWTIPLFISNFFSFDVMCMPHSWYISADFQCFLAIVVYFILIYRCPVLGKLYLGFLVIISCVGSGMLTYIYDLPPQPLYGNSDFKTFLSLGKILYSSMLNHLGVYAIGAAFGTFMARLGKTEHSNLLIAFGWVLSSCTALTAIFGVLSWNSGTKPTTIESVLFAALFRNAYAISFAWVVYICATNRGGIIAEFLSWSGFKPLSRIAYMTYLCHQGVLYSYGASLITPIDYSYNNLVWIFFGNVVVCFMAAMGLRVLYEAPVDRLVRIVIGRLFERNNKLESASETNRVETVLMQNANT